MKPSFANQTIYRPGGILLNCRDAHWLRKAAWWYELRFLRRWLLLFLKMIRVV